MNEQRFFARFLTVLLLLFTVANSGYAQLSSGAILGTVTDTSGAVVPGVSIAVTNTGTGLVRDAVTNESGNYRVDLLPVGSYQIAADLPGFRKSIRTGVNVEIDSRVRVDFALSVGDVSEVVNVEGQAPLVQTDSSGVGVVVEAQKIVSLPLNGRNFSQLAYIVPGAYAPRPNSQIGYRGGFQIAGGREGENQFLLDGINNNGNWTSEISARVNVDAVGEFKIQTSNYGAQYGRYSGAQVDAITKSGTNELHGTVFYFNRSNFLQARNFFDPWPLDKLPDFKRQQYGGVLGGPIIRDKSFFFVALAGQKLSSFLTVAANVPPAEFWNGDLSKSGATIRDPLTNQPFPGNIIPKDRISPIALGLQQLYPTPTRPGLANNYTSHKPAPDDYTQLTVKLDHQLTPRQKISFAETYYNEDLYEDYNGPTFAAYMGDSTINSFNASIGHTFTISPTLINEFRFGGSHLKRGRFFLKDVNGSRNWREYLGIQCCTQGDVISNSVGVPIINITNFSSIGGPNAFPQPRGDTNVTAFDTVSLQRGDHSFKIGIDYFEMFNNSIQSNDATGTFSFNGSRSGYAFADFLLGLPNQTRRQISLGPGTSNSRRSSMDFFIQDDWKVNSKLTLNLGIREELNWVMHDKYGMISRWDPTLGNGTGGFVIAPESHPRFDVALAAFKSYFPSITYQDGPYKKNDLVNIAPRLGFAYRLSSKTALRGGWGVFFNMPNLGENTSASSAAPPWVLRQTLTTANGITFTNPWGSGSIVGATISASSGTYERPTPYVHNFNLNIQQQMPGNWVLDVAYQGKQGVSSGSYNINQPRDRTTGIRPYSLFSGLTYTDAALTRQTYYNGLHVRSEKRAANGLTFLVSYEFGKNIQEVACQDAQLSAKGCVDRGLDSEDVRHRGTVSFVYQLPFGRDRKYLTDAPPLVDYLLGGWELSGIDRANSGYAFQPGINIDQSGTGDLNDRPDRIGDPNLGSSATPAAFWNRSAFALPARYSFGNAGVQTLTGPGYWTQDFSIAKKFSPAENQTITIRLELFNAFNHANFNDPSTTWNSTNFGQITSTVGSDGASSGSRQAQIGIKWIF